MNAVERSERRVKRFAVLTKINNLERTYCDVCPKKAMKSELTYGGCNDCPIFNQFGELGKQLIAVSHREELPEKVVDPEKVRKRANSFVYERRREREKLGIPPKKIPKVKPPLVKKRKKGDPSIVFTADEYIQAIAGGEYKSEIARRIGMPDSTLYHRTVKWGLVGLTKAQAREMLRAKEGESA